MLNLNCFNTTSDEKYARKWSEQVLLHADLVTPSQGHGHGKWYQIVEVKGVYKHGRYEKNWLKSLHIMSNVKVFAIQDSQLVGQTNMAHYIHTSIYYYYGSKTMRSFLKKRLTIISAVSRSARKSLSNDEFSCSLCITDPTWSGFKYFFTESRSLWNAWKASCTDNEFNECSLTFTNTK